MAITLPLLGSNVELVTVPRFRQLIDNKTVIFQRFHYLWDFDLIAVALCLLLLLQSIAVIFPFIIMVIDCCVCRLNNLTNSFLSHSQCEFDECVALFVQKSKMNWCERKMVPNLLEFIHISSRLSITNCALFDQLDHRHSFRWLCHCTLALSVRARKRKIQSTNNGQINRKEWQMCCNFLKSNGISF